MPAMTAPASTLPTLCRHLPVAGDAARLLAFLGLHAAGGVEAWDGRCLARVQRVPGGLAVVRLTATATGVDVEADLPSAGDEAAVLAAVEHLVGAGDDPDAAEAHLATDPVLGPLVASRPGLVAPGSVDHAETLLRTVIGQQVSLAGARAVTGRVVAAHGEPLPTPRAGLTAAFPTCEALAAADPATLPMPRARGRSVVAVAAALADDPSLLLDDEGLLALPGVGPWTVAYTRLRTRRDPDVFLPSDLGIRRQLEAMGLPADARSAAERSSAWAPFRTTALMHLWAELLDNRAAA
jgi:AraC family transcriptional regulator of adaptative response / DNA-3-methyladenine glycosylase II